MCKGTEKRNDAKRKEKMGNEVVPADRLLLPSPSRSLKPPSFFPFFAVKGDAAQWCIQQQALSQNLGNGIFPGRQAGNCSDAAKPGSCHVLPAARHCGCLKTSQILTQSLGAWLTEAGI